jgi:hypothetical protein
MKLPIALIERIFHIHVDVQYPHCGLDLYLADINHIVGSIAKLIHDMEWTPKYAFHILFENN